MMSRFVDLYLKGCASDQCIVHLTSLGGKEVGRAVRICMDDLIVTCENAFCRELRAFLQQFFRTKDLGSPSYYAGREYSRGRPVGTLKATQTACIDRLVETFGVTTWNPTPTLTSVSLNPRQGEEMQEIATGGRRRPNVDFQCHAPRHRQRGS